MSILEILGLLSVIYLGCRIFFKTTKCVYYYCIKAPIKRDVLLKQRGRWAGIVTLWQPFWVPKYHYGENYHPEKRINKLRRDSGIFSRIIERVRQKCQASADLKREGRMKILDVILAHTLPLINGMTKNIIKKRKSLNSVITGATDGIGKSYANALAGMGLNVVLISRDIKKLNEWAGNLEAKHNIQTKVIPIDFTKGVEIYDEIERVLSDLEIGVLVNNVGISYSYPEVFLDVPEKKKFFSAIIRANVVSVTKMCEISMPGMVKRKSGVVINISSASALIPSPMLTVYAATKCYVEKFSDELRNEYESEGLIIQTVLPGYVATKMSKIRKSSWMAPSADKFVQSALSKVGVFDHTTGYFPHTLFVNALNAVHSICRPFLIHLILRSMKGLRARALASLRKKVSDE